MNSRERVLAAIRGQNVDYVPFIVRWITGKQQHKAVTWKNERERLAYHKEKDLDAMVQVHAPVSPAASVAVKTASTTDAGGSKLFRQTWETPSGTLTETLRMTEDWDSAEIHGEHFGLGSDFRTARYAEYPFKNEKDLLTLPHIFPIENPYDKQRIVKEYNEQRALADEFGYPLFALSDAGMDWLLWLYPAQESVLRMMDYPEFTERLLEKINAAKHKRLELLLNLGVDGVIRRGYYESTDFWNPEIFRRVAAPPIKKEIEMTHAAGKVYLYLMLTGIKPILPDLAALDFDCLFGAEPEPVGMNLRDVRAALPGKSFWCGISDTQHFGAAEPEPTVKAVEEAFEIFGKKGFILGLAPSYREYWPYENFLAAERTWKRLR